MTITYSRLAISTALALLLFQSGGGAEPELVKSLSSEEEGFNTGGSSINVKEGGLSKEDHAPLLPRLQVTLPIIYLAVYIATYIE